MFTQELTKDDFDHRVQFGEEIVNKLDRNEMNQLSRYLGKRGTIIVIEKLSLDLRDPYTKITKAYC